MIRLQPKSFVAKSHHKIFMHSYNYITENCTSGTAVEPLTLNIGPNEVNSEFALIGSHHSQAFFE